MSKVTQIAAADAGQTNTDWSTEGVVARRDTYYAASQFVQTPKIEDGSIALFDCP